MLLCLEHRPVMKPVHWSPRKTPVKSEIKKVIPQMRKESNNYETSVYKYIIEKLPKEMANNGGAYVTYFAAFTPLSNKTSVSTSNLPIRESASLHFLHREVQDKITKSTSGVFERKCIFC